MNKYRAWDKNDKKMRKVETISFLTDFIECELDLNDDPVKYHDVMCVPLLKSEYILMQSTGLFDKNGVEIFEGDILKIIEVTNETMEEYLTDVAWEDASFVIKSKGVDYYDTFLAAWSGDPNKTYPLFELEVVGNICQNLELLKEVE